MQCLWAVCETFATRVTGSDANAFSSSCVCEDAATSILRASARWRSGCPVHGDLQFGSVRKRRTATGARFMSFRRQTHARDYVFTFGGLPTVTLTVDEAVAPRLSVAVSSNVNTVPFGVFGTRKEVADAFGLLRLTPGPPSCRQT